MYMDLISNAREASHPGMESTGAKQTGGFSQQTAGLLAQLVGMTSLPISWEQCAN
jgi:hypothetical protein